MYLAPRSGARRRNDVVARPRRPRRERPTIRPPEQHRDDRRALLLLGVVLAALVAAGIAPYDRRVFLLEVVPWVTLLGVLVVIHPYYRLTPLSQLAITGLCLLLA